MIRPLTSALLLALMASISLPLQANPSLATEPPAALNVPAAPVAAAQNAAPEAAAAAPANMSGQVLINSADAEMLARELSGIGAAKAQAIVAYREANGPFAVVDELLEVRGIGPAILEKNRARLSLD
ncbi:helix-hairpin-helix domain-containing protein [Pseudomonas sp. NW5]|uniref:ComEA family DNA-binding protein n=1 Tax=Pseudomonas sp. NW5 TaxID=2934934 RepID=UPI00202002E1|nr:helix-hairpin-helix domain-containing protein [Pseudomonas sp. NW5]MCL7463359.1 helix-hairpin-helix domain-containing protein [Pseudomonas sp. NW5]